LNHELTQSPLPRCFVIAKSTMHGTCSIKCSKEHSSTILGFRGALGDKIFT